jgi:hypothetical protein
MSLSEYRLVRVANRGIRYLQPFAEIENNTRSVAMAEVICSSSAAHE